jgi:hypothetical protein
MYAEGDEFGNFFRNITLKFCNLLQFCTTSVPHLRHRHARQGNTSFYELKLYYIVY